MQDDIRDTISQILAGQAPSNAATQLRSALLARLGQRSGDDPLRAALVRMISPTEAQSAGAQERGASVGTHDQMRQLLHAARDELNRLQALNSTLAAALGACVECWGADARCACCGGLGRPGWTRPDSAGFAMWVEPAIKGMKGSAPSAAIDGASQQFGERPA
jgi:hypothetical protein